jgi:sterol desaturase/sphingolipid hydroxylase (fatty acid hydroxylase superfamily)
MSVLILYAIPVFILSMVAEALWSWRARAAGSKARGYAPRDTAASLAMGLGNVGIAAVTKAVAFGAMVWLHQFALFDIGTAWWAWLLLFVAEDFCYYWYHRVHHEVRFFWAAHVNHHSSQHYNLSTALRQSWTTPFTGPLFWLPLPLLGFEPWMILVQMAVSLLYQFWLHTEAIDRLGPLEWVFNTPSHHRVHHGSNREYLDRNHGGILIIWDRLFGTFEPERAPVDYGLTRNLTSHHPLVIAFHEWAAIGRDVAGALRAGSPGDAIRYLAGPPGWKPGGGETTRSVQATPR